jgi:predicted nucleic acid-binding protein
MALLNKSISLKTHVFWKDDISLLDTHIPASLLVGHRQITDAYLLGLAIHHGGQFVTLDGGVSNLLPSNSQNRDAIRTVLAGS